MKSIPTINSWKHYWLLLLLMVTGVSSSFGTAKGSLTLSNCTAGPNYIEYQVNVNNTSDAGEVIYLNSFTPRLNHLAGIVPTGTNTFSYQYITGSCDPAVANWFTTLGTTYNVAYTASSRLMQCTQTATIYGNSAAASNVPIPVGGTVNCGRFRLTITNTNFVANANVGLSWVTTSGFTGYVNTGTSSVNFNTTTNRTLGTPCTLTIPAACSMTASASTINAACYGASNGSVTVSTTNGTSPYTYSWSPSSAGSTATASGLSAGSYSVTVTDANGCTASASATVTQPAQPAQPSLACYQSATWSSASCQWVVSGTQPAQPSLACYQTATFNNSTCQWVVTGTQPAQPTLACYQTASFNTNTCSWDVTGTQPAQPSLACYQSATFNNGTCSWDVTGTQPAQPSLACYQSATFNGVTCQWDVTGTQPAQPSLACYQSATFNTNTCSWDVTGTQPAQPSLACYQSATFNNGTCSWDVTGTQPAQPSLACYESATFNNGTCSWDVTGTQPAQPSLACYQSATFNNGTCSWDVTGTQPAQPSLACYQSASFNGVTCQWDVTGTQPAQPSLACYESATFNNGTCSWDVTGTQPAQPSLACYQSASFNGVTCQWDVTGTQPAQPSLACYQSATFNNGTCSWDVTGTQPAQPSLACYQSASFNGVTCQWDVTGTQPAQPSLACYQSATFNNGTCSWDVTGSQPAAPTGLACWQSASFNTVSCQWDVTGSQPQQPALECYQSANFNTATCSWDVTGTPLTASASLSAPMACFGGTASISVSAAGGSGTYIGTGVQVVGAGSYTFTVADDNGCIAVTNSVSVTEPSKVQGSTTAVNASCGQSDGSATVTASGGAGSYTYLWSNGATTATANGLGGGSYTVTITDANGCTGTASATITAVGAVPSAAGPVSGSPGACRGSVYVYSIAPVAGASGYNWVLPAGATGSSNTTSITVTFGNSYNGGFICVTPTNTCGGGGQSCMNVPVLTVKPNLPGVISGPATACGPGVYTYSVAPVANALSYNWTVNTTTATIISGQGTNTIQLSVASGFTSASLGVTASNCVGTSSIRYLSLSGLATITSALSGPIYVCPNQTVNYSISAASGSGISGYSWAVTGNATVVSSNGTSCTVSTAANWNGGVLTCTVTTPCGNSSRAYNLYKSPLQPGAITGPANNLCVTAGVSTASYSIAAVAGATSYSWTVPAGMTITSNTGTNIMVTISSSFNSGNLCVTANNSCGSSAARCLAVSKAPAVPGSVSGPASVCKNQSSVAYSIVAVAGATGYSWAISGGASIVGAGTNATANYNTATSSSAVITVNATNQCGSSQPTRLTVAVNLLCRQAQSDVTPVLTAFPNPASGKVTVNFTASSADRYTVRLVDLLGKQIYSTTVNAVEGLNVQEIELSQVVKGIYLLNVQSQSGDVQTLRLVVE